MRELLRQRLGLVQQQTQYILKIQGLLVRYQNIKLSGEQIKKLTDDQLLALVIDKNLRHSIESLHQVLVSILQQIQHLELLLMDEISAEQDYKNLLSVPGIGKILATTILLETGDIKRFRSSGSYVSYCRCVPSHCESNGKKKGENNRKNGNPYLSWAFMEAANMAIRFYPEIKKYYQKKMEKTHRVVALKTVAHKLARASYYVLRDDIEFQMKKAFG